MKTLFCLLITAVTHLAQAKPPVAKNASVVVPGVGLVRIQHEVVGEPISQPERVQVFVTCEGQKTGFRIAVFRMCTYDGHTFEAGPKILTLTMHYGRVEPKSGDVICDQYDMKSVALADVCRNHKQR